MKKSLIVLSLLLILVTPIVFAFSINNFLTNLFGTNSDNTRTLEASTYSCIKSDGSSSSYWNLDVQGKIDAKNGLGTNLFTSTTGWDYCKYGDNTNILIEGYCKSINSNFAEVDCSQYNKKCVGGKCVTLSTSAANTCVDSDNEKDYFTAGNVKDTLGAVYYDGCSDQILYPNRLAEAYCSGGNVAWDYYTCPNGCENGACKISSLTSCTALLESSGKGVAISTPVGVCFESCHENKMDKFMITKVNWNTKKINIKILSVGDEYSNIAFTPNVPTTIQDIDSKLVLNIGTNSITLTKKVECISTLDNVQTGNKICDDSYLIETPQNKLTLGKSLFNIKPTITSLELKRLLKKETWVDEAGDNSGNYYYSQIINFNPYSGIFVHEADTNRPGKPIDNYIFFDNSLMKYAWNYSLEVTGSRIKIKDPADIEGNKLTILGRDYIIVDALTSNLSYGTLDKIILLTGDKITTLTKGSTQAGVTLVDVDEAETKCVITYLGKTYIINKGEIKTMSDSTLIGAIDMVSSQLSSQEFCKLAVGARRIVLEQAKEVEVNNEKISGTLVALNDGTTGFKHLDIIYSPEDKVRLKKGESLIDPVFDSFKISFDSMNQQIAKVFIKSSCSFTTTSCTPTTFTPALNTLCGTKIVTTNCGNKLSKQGTLTCTAGKTCINNLCRVLYDSGDNGILEIPDYDTAQNLFRQIPTTLSYGITIASCVAKGFNLDFCNDVDKNKNGYVNQTEALVAVNCIKNLLSGRTC
ncbi:MAG: hypothetical protein PHD81_01005 [Candidatus Nanoarchaeia archaeon]|nr:hypothetical protein [Candidatus Nanoarchaeia archaeon]MDD5587669.1 hypothetical protein [Candidatus Nanoarchaeia archaeon]